MTRRALLVSAIASGQGKTTLTASYFHAYFNSCPQAIAALLTGADP